MDAHAATELKLFIDNDGNLYERLTKGILRNLMAKRARGQYKHDLAVKALGYLTEAGAKKYVRDYVGTSTPWHKMFDVATRKRVSEVLTRDFEQKLARGEYNWLLPDKKLTRVPSHARKKSDPYSLVPRSKGGFDARVNAALTGTSKSAKAQAARSLRLKAIEAQRAANTAERERISSTSGVSARDIWEFAAFVRSVSDRQLQGVYDKEKRAGRDEYVEVARDEAVRRGVELDDASGGHNGHARKKAKLTSSKTQASRSVRQPALNRGAQGFSSNDLMATVSFNGRVIAARTSRGWTPTGAASGDIARALSESIFAFPVDISAGDLRRRVIDILGSDQTDSSFDGGGGHNDHARRKQLDREILQVVPSYRWRP